VVPGGVRHGRVPCIEASLRAPLQLLMDPRRVLLVRRNLGRAMRKHCKPILLDTVLVVLLVTLIVVSGGGL